ncbi:hypothetical protein Q4610_10895 [Sphingobium sp. HBC34]|uniref:OmpR/PhoB-type domain-containing protein n=1 Tax=Sphingobium cyanobacteriorum TaxID=3063954 RepID=A0ABT8ZLY1_9SPHN|nr:hypothetical protein [Sphingobium sp. HBC34]MDO7835549.1 hypothetical protein [Sphingobium sp. HBC34]
MPDDSPPPSDSDAGTDRLIDDGPDTPRQQLIDQARRVRAMIGSKRSDKLLRLFDFLLERTLEGRSPSEIDIANEAFSIGQTIDTPQDATVRVYVHRLRKLLEQAQADMPGRKLFIPKGEYALMLADDADAPAIAASEEYDGADDSDGRRQRPAMIGAVLALLLLANIAGWWLFFPRWSESTPSALAQTALWRPIAQDDRPITIVLGDYYLFAETAKGQAVDMGPPRLVRDPSINAREDLDIYLMARPQERARIRDLDMRYVPSSAVMSLGDLFDALRAIKGQSGRRISMIPVSQLTADLLKSSDIVYVGQISGLGAMLRNPLFQASGFRVGTTYDELIDTVSRRRYQADGGQLLADERVARRDFGYMARLPGPSGNHIVIIAGARDAALRQMAEFASEPVQLNAMDRKATADARGFESLYQVRAMGNLNISGQLLVTRPLRSRGIWDRSTPSQRFPHDDYEGEGHVDP